MNELIFGSKSILYNFLYRTKFRLRVYNYNSYIYLLISNKYIEYIFYGIPCILCI